MEKQQKNIVEIAFINIVLYPTENQKPEKYVRLLSSIMQDRYKVKSGKSERETLLRTFDNCGSYYHGYFCNAIFLGEDSKTLNVNENTLEDSDTDPNKGIDAKDMEFWYYPKYHRFAVYKTHLKRIFKFLNDSFLFKLGDNELFAINIENDKQTIEKIIQAKTLLDIRVSVRYTNNDNFEDWEELDESLRSSNTEQADLYMKSPKSKPIEVAKNKVLKAFLYLSKSYGTAKARILNDAGHTEKINTQNHPNTMRVDLNDDAAHDMENYILDVSKNKK